MKLLSLSFGTVIVLLAVVVLAAACGGGDSSDTGHTMDADQPAGSIRVGLVNWAMEPAQSEARAGTVTFWAVHDVGHAHSGDEGGATHDLQVMRKNADGSLKLVGEVTGLTMGQAKGLTLDLTPGDYELSCNVVEVINGQAIGHYAKGMKTAFKVTA